MFSPGRLGYTYIFNVHIYLNDDICGNLGGTPSKGTDGAHDLLVYRGGEEGRKKINRVVSDKLPDKVQTATAGGMRTRTFQTFKIIYD